MVAMHVLRPNVLIAPADHSDTDPTGIPLWSFGVLPTAFVIPNLIGLAVPGVKVWLAMHNWAIVTWGLLAVTIWLTLALVS